MKRYLFLAAALFACSAAAAHAPPDAGAAHSPLTEQVPCLVTAERLPAGVVLVNVAAVAALRAGLNAGDGAKNLATAIPVALNAAAMAPSPRFAPADGFADAAAPPLRRSLRSALALL